MVQLTEFEFIECYVTNLAATRPDVVLSVGDDAAIVNVPSDKSLVITTDSMVEGRHFLPDTPAHVLGYRLLAMNLSDLAAMGAQPAWAMLSLTTPHLETQWLDDFFQGFQQLATKYNITLIGGNTTQGPLNLTLQLHGFVPCNQALTRRGAKIGDKIVVTGTLGDATLGLNYLRGQLTNLNETQKEFILNRLYYPIARVELGEALLNHAHAAIDISDGLAADLNHILQASGVGAVLEIEKLPYSMAMLALCDTSLAQQIALYSGDNYELCFTIAAEKIELLKILSEKYHVTCTVIGEIIAETGLFTVNSENNRTAISPKGWDHFA